MRTLSVAAVLAVSCLVSAGVQAQTRFTAHLTGINLAGQPVATNASGQASLEVEALPTGRKVVKYRINVAGLANMFMAHIHIFPGPGPVQLTGPVGPVAFWFAPTTPPAAVPGFSVAEQIQGTMAAGYIFTDTQLVGPLTPDPADPAGTGLAGLVKAMEEGRASIVVHTNDFDPNTPTGVAGDSAAGELRGTIR